MQQPSFAIYPMDDQQSLPGQSAERISGYEFIWIQSGIAMLLADGREYALSRHRVYCLAPGQLRKISFAGACHGYRITMPVDYSLLAANTVELSFLPAHYELLDGAVFIELNDEAAGEMGEILQMIQHEIIKKAVFAHEIVNSLFTIFLLNLSRHYRVREESRVRNKEQEMVSRFIRLLTSHFTTQKMVVDYADQLCVTPSYLNLLVKRITGKTASYHIQQCVVLEAKRRAIHSGKSMKEIAYELGFDDCAHFSKFFKSISGVNFTSFKKRMLCN